MSDILDFELIRFTDEPEFECKRPNEAAYSLEFSECDGPIALEMVKRWNSYNSLCLDFPMEELAAIEHERWSSWQKYMHSKCTKNEDGSLTIPADSVTHWEGQIKTPYSELSEREKQSDRKDIRASTLKTLQDQGQEFDRIDSLTKERDAFKAESDNTKILSDGVQSTKKLLHDVKEAIENEENNVGISPLGQAIAQAAMETAFLANTENEKLQARIEELGEPTAFYKDGSHADTIEDAMQTVPDLTIMGIYKMRDVGWSYCFWHDDEVHTFDTEEQALEALKGLESNSNDS